MVYNLYYPKLISGVIKLSTWAFKEVSHYQYLSTIQGKVDWSHTAFSGIKTISLNVPQFRINIPNPTSVYNDIINRKHNTSQ